MPIANANFRRPPFSRANRLRAILTGILVLALLAGAFFGYQFFFASSKAPSPAALQSAVAEQLSARHGTLYTLAAFQPGTPSATPSGEHLRFNATATARQSEALYELVNATDFIAREMKLDTSAEQKIARIVSGPGGERIRELAGIDAKADSLASMKLVRESARTGSRHEFRAVIDAVRTRSGNDNGWRINVVSLAPLTPLPEGETLDKFSGRLLDITRESDLATLRRMVAQGDETLRRVEQARERYRAESAASATRIIYAALAQLAPGALFTGPATLRGSDGNARSRAREHPELCLELVSADPITTSINARLRADSSWLDARTLAGNYRYDPENGVFTVTLTSPEGPPLASATGTRINDTRAFKLTLQFADNTLLAETDAWTCRLARVPDAARAGAVARFSAYENTLFDATRPGTVFHVRTTAVLEPGDDAPDVILRILTQNRATGALTASLENMHGIWTRHVHGALVANPARPGGFPLRFDDTEPSKILVLELQAPAAASRTSAEAAGKSENVFKGSIRMLADSGAAVTAGIALEPAGAAYLDRLPALAKARDERRRVAEEAAANIAALHEAIAREGPFHASRLPVASGAYVLDGGIWKPLPTNDAKVLRSAFQRIGGVWSAAVGLVKTQPDKQDTGTLTFEGGAIPPAVVGRDITLLFRGALKTYAGAPAGKPHIEVAALEIKNKGRRRAAELDRLGDAAATFGKNAVPVIIERHATVPDAYIVRVQRPLPAGRYALCAPDLPFEFGVR